MPYRNSLLAVPVQSDGMYESDDVAVLQRNDPWRVAAGKLLRLAGQAVELPNGDDDRYLANLFLCHAMLIDAERRKPTLKRESEAVQWSCFQNARRAAERIIGSRLTVGLAHHCGWAWVAHTWATLPLGTLVEATDLARWYWGVEAGPHGDKLLRRWERALST